MINEVLLDRAKVAARNLKRLVESNSEIGTQERFAELMGVDVRTVRRWYARLDSLTTIRDAANILGVDDMEILIES